MGELQRGLNSSVTAFIHVRDEDFNIPAYHLQVRSFYDLYHKLHTLNKGLFSMEQMSIVLKLPLLTITDFSSAFWHSFLLLPPGSYCHHHLHASGSFGVGGGGGGGVRYKTKAQEELRKGRDVSLVHATLRLTKCRLSSTPQWASLTWCSIIKLPNGLVMLQKGWGELQKPTLPLVQLSQ